ncbi:DUF3035 domain-containing protein [Paracoccus sp. p4-l81]|uniref:DUF3035 domain-containing protein n=1 Tax=unclassified Paracoccus (in: a-proteobacteria) TaxID=2688777 RepID=UPI0035B72C09
MRGLSAGMMMGLALVLAGCGSSGDAPILMHAGAGSDSPDEFGVLPTKPLQMPPDLAALPAPTPGGRNLVDPTPMEDAVAALGGNPAALARGGINAGDGALIAHAGRFGGNAQIRSQLAAEDLDYRRRNDGRLLERAFSVNVYDKAYRPYALNAYQELERWRRAGARTPSAPPAPLD